MVPDQAILDLASDSGYEHFHTATDNSRSSRTGKAYTNSELIDPTDNDKNYNSERAKRSASIDVKPTNHNNYAVQERYGLQPTFPQSSYPTIIKVKY